MLTHEKLLKPEVSKCRKHSEIPFYYSAFLFEI